MLCDVCLPVLCRPRIKLAHDANVNPNRWNSSALACAVCLWLFMVYRRYRAGTEVDMLRKENIELKKRLETLEAESGGGGHINEILRLLLSPP